MFYKRINKAPPVFVLQKLKKGGELVQWIG